MSARPKSSSTTSSSRPTSRTHAKASVPSQGGRNAAAIASDSTKRQIVGQYMLGKTIGEGTFGKVKLAVHMPTGEKVAVKILEKSRIKESADVRRVNREIKILKKARHGNIIQLYEVLDTQHAIYLIMECAEGGEMFDFIVAQKHVAELQACKFFHQIVEGVDMLHKNDITHRDLKPENLLLKASPDGWIVKVVDFGLSNTHEGNRLLTTACGSPCYAAPEMIAGRKYFGPLADIWSMGVILFALVCGFLPFEDANTAVLYKKILSGEYKTPKWISPEVKDLIRCILEVDPRKRYTMDDIRKHPWYRMVSEVDVPKEIINQAEDERLRNETISQLTAAGVDTQALLDGLASHACNSLTALYYLSEQKYRAKKGSNQQKSQGEINNRSESTQSAQPSAQRVAVPPENVEVPVVKQSPLYTNVPGNQPSPYGPPQQQQPQPVNNTAKPVAPYLQAPPILQQKPQQQQQPVHTNNMPSLDYYMKTGFSIPIGNENKNINKPNSIPPVQRNGEGGMEIPKIAIKQKPVIPALQKPVSNGQPVDTLISQTAREPVVPAIKLQAIQGIPPISGPQSARPVMSGDTGPMIGGGQHVAFMGPPDILNIGDIEGNGRPNTRRSRGRSRGVDNGEMFLEALPAEGPLETGPNNTPQNMGKPIEIKPMMGNAVNNKFINQAPMNAKHNITVSQNPNTQVPNTNLAPVMQSAAAPVVMKAPEAPRASSAQGGRRGKNLVPAGTATPTETAVTAAPAQPMNKIARPQPGPPQQQQQLQISPQPQSIPVSGTESKQEAVRNKMAAQGTFNISAKQ